MQHPRVSDGILRIALYTRYRREQALLLVESTMYVATDVGSDRVPLTKEHATAGTRQHAAWGRRPEGVIVVGPGGSLTNPLAFRTIMVPGCWVPRQC